MMSVVALLFSSLLATVAGQSVSTSTLYTATTNLSSSSWVSRVVSTRPATSVLTCAGHCQDRAQSSGDCNSFNYQAASSQCELGSLTFLEDPAPGESSVRLMVVEELVDSLKMYCRGGDGCCGVGSNRLCGEGEGDCDHDDQCAGLLECGQDNCATKVRLSLSPPYTTSLTARLEGTGTTLTTVARPDVPQTGSVCRAGGPAPPAPTVREVRTDIMSVTRLA